MSVVLRLVGVVVEMSRDEVPEVVLRVLPCRREAKGVEGVDLVFEDREVDGGAGTLGLVGPLADGVAEELSAPHVNAERRVCNLCEFALADGLRRQ